MTFGSTQFQALKKAYNEAVASNQEQFQFEGNTLLVAYAKYLIQYLDGHLHETIGRNVT